MQRGRHRRFRPRRLATSLSVVAGLLILAMGGTFVFLGWVGASGIEQVDFDGPDVPEPGVAAPSEAGPVIEELSGVTNVLLVGSDSRESLTDEELLRIGTSREDRAGLTDTIMLVRLDATNDRAAVLSFPRDLLVERCDRSTGRINGAFEVGEQLTEEGWTGPSCLGATIREFAGVEVDHYVEVDFSGFIAAVDAVGGVTFNLDQPMDDPKAGIDLPAGCTTFDGTSALGFVRARNLDPSGDYGRIARQQRFLRELVAKATSLETLSQPSRVFGLVNAVSGAIRTDQDLSPTEMARLGYTFRSLTNDGIETFVIPGVDRKWNGADVLEPAEGTEDVIDAFLSAGAPMPAPSVPAGGGGGGEGPGGTVAPGTPAAAPSAGAPTPTPTPTPTPGPTFNNGALSDVAC